MSEDAGATELAELTELFATPPPEFVEARNALAKRLRADKRREEAAAVAKIRRPNWVDWALNAVATAEPDLVADFAGAAEVLREAQASSIEGRDGPDLRGALRALRDATTALGRQAGRALADAGRDPDTAEVTSRLGEIAAQAGAVDQLRAGVLGSTEPGDEDPFAGLTPAAPAKESGKARAPATTKAKATGKAAPKRDGVEADDGDAEPEAEAPAERAAAKNRAKERAAAEAAAADAAKAEQAARRVERARLEKAVTTARKRSERAEERFRAAQRALDEARADLDDATERLDEATAELEGFDADTLAP